MDSKRVMIFSGAGLSAESGLRTFRDNDGLWEEFDIMEVCSASGFARDKLNINEAIFQKKSSYYLRKNICLNLLLLDSRFDATCVMGNAK